jgi:hypothetical protein
MATSPETNGPDRDAGPGGIGRRALLRGTAGAAALATLAGTGAAARASAPLGTASTATPEARLAERLGGVIARRASAARLGLAYLEGAPDEADAGLLARELAGRLAADGRALDLLDAPDEAIAERVAARCRADFAEDDTVRVGGWVLARTEARLCALVALGDA